MQISWSAEGKAENQVHFLKNPFMRDLSSRSNIQITVFITTEKENEERIINHLRTSLRTKRAH